MLICTGLAVILSAQLWPGLPVAAAIALIGCGATGVMCQQLDTRHRRLRLCGSLLVYAALVGLAVGAQLHLRNDAIYVADAVVAVLLLLTAVQTTFQRTDSASSW
ncbi:hypothetical protein [Bythopirellula polymerisocia]|uniref:Uncharacterized protein n=1 Tax=Bythopirellula polymerisocia TaxID=2528003 RepID=A0A5C6CY24_9BACT|nr:hypothetical protein [Bythopirellula polymerisocia]TWU29298.1 hypothetical protein Pla144_00740 [Bythopirellula polymerisocia]